MKKKILLPFLFFLTHLVFSNNVQVGTPSIIAGSPSYIQFTIQWDNSWRLAPGAGPANWDAVWIFVKYQDCSTNLWQHVDLNTTAGQHTIGGTQLEVITVADAKGVYLRLNTNTITNINNATITLKFASLADAGYNYQVFAVEMVNIPSGDFYIGDGTRGSSGYGFSDVNPYPAKLITNAIQTAGLGAASNYQYNSWGSAANLPSTFPLGWNSFYCMKYEISQDQYASFLNTLTFDQQVTRAASSPASAVGTQAISGAPTQRNGIKIKTTGTLNNVPATYGCDLNNDGVFGGASDGMDLACNWLQWTDLTAYLDWAALRPMTEFEFEKVCRGPSSNSALPNEYAWGSTSLLQAESGALSNAGQSSEASTTSGAGLCAYGANVTTKGPLRCGFAATSLTNRVQAGAAWYGAMDMSGNVGEQCLGGYNYNYSAFTNATGDGSLSTVGNANVSNWPSPGGGQNGAVVRGSDWFTTTAAYLNVSDRIQMVDNSNQTRNARYGGRGVR